MSHTFMPVFFPELHAWERAIQLLPESLCEDPGPTQINNSIHIRWPLLLPCCVLGVLVGLVGSFCLYGDRRRGSTVHASWIYGFLFFGFMNITAAFSHCLLPDVTTLSGTVWRALDVGCTGAACVSCMHAAASALRQAAKGSKGPTRRRGRTALLVLGLNMSLLGAAVLGNMLKVPWTNEIIYVALALLCVPVVALDFAVAWSPASTATRWWMLLALLGLFLCGLGQPLEAHLCALSGSHLNAIHTLFLGCDIMFLGLAGYLRAHHRIDAHHSSSAVHKQE